MSRINRVPEGLQSLLGSQNLGNNPSNFAETAIPVVPLDKFFSPGIMGRETAAVAANGIGAEVLITVPQGQVWEPIVLRGSVGNTFNAGGRATVKLAVQFPDPTGLSGGGLVIQDLKYSDAPTILDGASTAVSYGTTYTWSKNVMYGPGTQFRVSIVDLLLTGASVTLASSVHFLRYRT